MELALFSLILLATAALITAPLRRNALSDDDAPELEALESARDAKLREIQDAELDLRIGKLSPQDHRRVDRALRTDALALMDRIDAARPGEGPRSER
jgi:hypothetical protein